MTEPSRDIRTDVPGAARIWNYWLGGKDNYEADRLAAEAALEYYDMATFARQSRQFLNRVVRFLSAEAGIRQFLDIGTGIPTSPNVHEVVQGIAPAAHVAYVDNDHRNPGCAHEVHDISPGRGGLPVEPQLVRPVGNGRTDRSCSRAR